MSYLKRAYQLFHEKQQPAIVCPYCMEPNQLDPPLPCCKEVHAEECTEVELADGTYYPFLEGEEREAFEIFCESWKLLAKPDPKPQGGAK